jgi:hypothetical protein
VYGEFIRARHERASKLERIFSRITSQVRRPSSCKQTQSDLILVQGLGAAVMEKTGNELTLASSNSVLHSEIFVRSKLHFVDRSWKFQDLDLFV